MRARINIERKYIVVRLTLRLTIDLLTRFVVRSEYFCFFITCSITAATEKKKNSWYKLLFSITIYCDGNLDKIQCLIRTVMIIL